jgi:hypothetical protein
VFTFVNDLCAADEVLKGWSNGNKVCVKRYEPTSRCSNVSPPTAAMVGVDSNGTIKCANMDEYVNQGVNIIMANLNICLAKYPPSSGYSGHSYNPTTKQCSAAATSVSVSYKDGCGPLWDKDDAGSCGCWGGWTWNGYDNCTFNWVVAGGICKCAQDVTTNYSCTVSGGWCW